MESKELNDIKAKLLNNTVLTIEESYTYADDRDECISGYPVLLLTLANGDTIELGLAEYTLTTIEERTKREQEAKEASLRREQELRGEIKAKELTRNLRAKVRGNIRI
jgi:hypothetical protein